MIPVLGKRDFKKEMKNRVLASRHKLIEWTNEPEMNQSAVLEVDDESTKNLIV